MRRQKNCFKRNNKIKPQEKNANKMEINNLLHKEFKAIIIKMLTKLKKIEKQSENTNKKLENILKNQSELKNIITEMKNTLDCVN